MSIIPSFQDDGLLPKGDYEVTFDELRQSVLVAGPSNSVDYPNWDTPWRLELVDNLEILVQQLWLVGIINIFADGSFAEDKDHPNDIDGYFECDLNMLVSGDLERKLNLQDPSKVWTWDPNSRTSYQGYPKKQLPMWHKYRVELYPHVKGRLSGIPDKHGNELEFPAAFRQSRSNGNPRGIVKLNQGGQA